MPNYLYFALSIDAQVGGHGTAISFPTTQKKKKKNFGQGRKKFSLYITYTSGRLNLLLQKWIMFIYRRLTSYFKSISEKRIYRSTVGQTIVLFSFMIEISSEECSNLWKMIIFCIFSGLDPFPQVFGQVERVTYVRTAQNNKVDT